MPTYIFSGVRLGIFNYCAALEMHGACSSAAGILYIHTQHPCGNSPAHMDSCILYAKNRRPPFTTEMAHLKNANMGVCWGLRPSKKSLPRKPNTKKYIKIQKIQIKYKYICKSLKNREVHANLDRSTYIKPYNNPSEMHAMAGAQHAVSQICKNLKTCLYIVYPLKMLSLKCWPRRPPQKTGSPG